MATLVQSNSVEGLGVASQSVALLASATAGNTIIVQVSWIDVGTNTATTLGTPTDANGTVQTAINPTSTSTPTNGISGAAIFYVPNCNAGTHNTTVNKVSAGASPLYVDITIEEWSGLTATPLDQTSSAGSSNANSSTTGNTGTTAALSQSNELVVANLQIYSGTGLSPSAGISHPPSGYTGIYAQQNTATGVGTEVSYKEANSTSGQIATWTWTSDNTQFTWQASIATFKEAVSTQTIFATRLPQFPNRGPNPKNYGARLLGFRNGAQGIVTQTFSYVASGGLIFGGAAAQARVKVTTTPSGGIIFGGAASVSFVGTQHFSYTASGGLVFGGIAASARVSALIAAGGITFGGAAAISYHQSTRIVSPSGGIVFSGVAGASFFSVGSGNASLPSHVINNGHRWRRD